MPRETRLDYQVVEVEEDVWLCDNCHAEIPDGEGYTHLAWQGRHTHPPRNSRHYEFDVDEYLCEHCATRRDYRRLTLRHLAERPLWHIEDREAMVFLAAYTILFPASFLAVVVRDVGFWGAFGGSLSFGVLSLALALGVTLCYDMLLGEL